MGCAGSIPTTKPNDQILGLHQRLGVQMNQLVIAHEQNKEITTTYRQRAEDLEKIIEANLKENEHKYEILSKDVTRWRILATSYAETYDRDFDRLAEALVKLQRSQDKVRLLEQKLKEYDLNELEYEDYSEKDRLLAEESENFKILQRRLKNL